MNAAYLAEIGYNMRADTPGRDPLRAFQIDTFSPFNNRMRTDVVFGTAGATFGRLQADGKTAQQPIDIDRSLMKMVAATEAQPPVSAGEAASYWNGTGWDGYNEWKKRFVPDSALDDLKAQAGF